MAPSDPLTVGKPRVARQIEAAVVDGLRAVREARVVVACCEHDGVVSIRDDADGRLLVELRYPTKADIDAVVFAPGRECLVACAQGLLKRWQITGDPSELSVKQPLTVVRAARVSPSGRFLGTSIWYRDGGMPYPRLRVQDMLTLQIVRQSQARIQRSAGRLAFDAVEDRLLAHDAGELFEWDLSTGEERFLPPVGDVVAMAMHPARPLAAVAAWESYEVLQVQLLDTTTGVPVGRRVVPLPDVNEMFFSSDGRHLILRHLYWVRVFSVDAMREGQGPMTPNDPELVAGWIGPGDGVLVWTAHLLPGGRLIVTECESENGDCWESVRMLPRLEIERRRPMAGKVLAAHALPSGESR